MYKFLFSCIRFVYNDVHLQNTVRKYVLVIINPRKKKRPKTNSSKYFPNTIHSPLLVLTLLFGHVYNAKEIKIVKK